MQLHICAVGRLRKSPERTLLEGYQHRFNRIGNTVSLGPLSEHEVEDKKGQGPEGEATLLKRAVPKKATLIALDEHGKQLSSPEFAEVLAYYRDVGQQDLAFLIGGADGLDPALHQNADRVISFGAMVWPHMFVRIMLAEQIYRAATILCGHPYHRI